MSDILDSNILTTKGDCYRIVCNCFGEEGGPVNLAEKINCKRVLLPGAGVPKAALELYTHLGIDNPTSIVSLDARYGTDLHDMNKKAYWDRSGSK